MDFDLKTLNAFRSLVGRTPALDRLIAFCATWLFYLLLLLVVVSLVEVDAALAAAALRVFTVAVVAVLVAEAISWTVGLLLYRERPFTHLKFTPLVWMSPRWKSFPSDHTTIGLTIACTYLFLGSPFGALFLVLAALVGLARIAAGVHYPSDVLAGALLAAVVAYGVTAAANFLTL